MNWRSNAWLRRLAWGVGTLLGLWVLAWLAVPPLLKWQGQTRLSEALGREVTIGEVSFRPWTLELTATDIAIAGSSAGAGAASAPPLLRVARLHVDAAITSIFRLAPVIEALEIDSPQLRVSRTSAGHYDIDDLLARFTPPATPPPPSEPQRFALYNLQIRDATVQFDDKPVGRVQKVEALRIAVPFVSNLPAEVEVKVEPRVAFKLNGTAFDSGAQATPFAQTRTAALKLTMADLDVTPYLGYLPDSLPARLVRGFVSADIALNFAQAPTGEPSVALKGHAGARDLGVTDAAGVPLLAWKQFSLGLRDVQPLARKLAFDTLRIEGADLRVSRDAKGGLNLLRLAAAGGSTDTTSSATSSAASAGSGTRATPATPASPASPASPATPSAPATLAASAPSAASTPAAAPAASSTSATPSKPWQVSVEAVELADARVLWNDATVHPVAAMQLDGLSLTVKQVRWPIAAPMPLSLAATLRDQREGAAPGGSLSAEGTATDQAAKVDLKIAGLSIDAFAPYIAQAVVPRVAGTLSAQATLDWSGAADAPRTRLTVASATLDALRIGEGSSKAARDAVGLRQLALADARVDLLARSVELGSVKLAQPSVSITRDREGRLNLQDWAVAPAPPASAPGMAPTAPLPKAAPAAPSPKAAPMAAAATAGTPWRVQLKSFLLEGGHVDLADAQAGRVAGKDALRIELDNLRASVQGLSLVGDRTVAPAKAEFSGRVGTAAAPREKAVAGGLLDWKGEFGLQPVLASGTLRIERFPVHLFEPYFRQSLPVSLLRAEAGYKGNFSVREGAGGWAVNSAGDVLIADVRIDTPRNASTAAGLASTDELLSWESLVLKGVKVAVQPGAKPKIEIGEMALSDFFSRLVITEEGKFNLRDVGAPGAAGSEGARAPAAAAGASSVAAAAGASSVAVRPVVAPSEGLPIDLRVAATKLVNGHIDFTDHFVRPNYSANLTELNGQIGAFSSALREMATIELRGKAAGTALLEITGALNPTVNPPILDIRAKATDLELAPLSPYAGKYAGYAIQRGKLTMDVAYKIEPDGKLTASNQVIVNQLTFGDKIDSPDATKLPVLLAVALLKDRNGVIDLNLPISGSLNDPKFSIGGLIVKVIVNLLTKAFTSPFALLAGGGGGDDLSLVEFVPGTALIAPSGQAALDKVAKALLERPNLKMTVTGAADPASERDAYQRAALDARLLAERRREALRAGAAASAPASLSADDRARLLKAVYKDTELPDKPRNPLGFAKDIPAPEMEALLLPGVPFNVDLMRELALQRGVAVRDALIAKGLASERLFLAAPQVRASAEDDKAWTPRVQLALTVN